MKSITKQILCAILVIALSGAVRFVKAGELPTVPKELAQLLNSNLANSNQWEVLENSQGRSRFLLRQNGIGYYFSIDTSAPPFTAIWITVNPHSNMVITHAIGDGVWQIINVEEYNRRPEMPCGI